MTLPLEISLEIPDKLRKVPINLKTELTILRRIKYLLISPNLKISTSNFVTIDQKKKKRKRFNNPKQKTDVVIIGDSMLRKVKPEDFQTSNV